jgi:hypothetical protein
MKITKMSLGNMIIDLENGTEILLSGGVVRFRDCHSVVIPPISFEGGRTLRFGIFVSFEPYNLKIYQCARLIGVFSFGGDCWWRPVFIDL